MAKKKPSKLTPKEVFLSHSSKNKKFVDELANVLTTHGVPIWLSSTNLMGAQQWHDEIGAALKRCDWFVIVISKQSVKSEWVKRELVHALNDRKYRNRIVPILLQECETDKLSWTLSQMQMVDFRANAKIGYEELLRVWGIGYKS